MIESEEWTSFRDKYKYSSNTICYAVEKNKSPGIVVSRLSKNYTHRNYTIKVKAKDQIRKSTSLPDFLAYSNNDSMQRSRACMQPIEDDSRSTKMSKKPVYDQASLTSLGSSLSLASNRRLSMGSSSTVHCRRGSLR